MGMKWFTILLFTSALHCSALVVTTNSDSGPGSLRQAVADAADGDTITFGITGQIVLSGGELLINKNLTIVGPGADNLTLVGGPGGNAIYPGDGTVSCRLFVITNPAVSVTISNIWMRGGHATSYTHFGNTGDPGGAIYNAGTLMISGCVISDSRSGSSYITEGVTGFPSAGSGGAVFNTGTLTLTSCSISNNAVGVAGPGFAYGVGHRGSGGAAGGAICNLGSLTMLYCTVNDNTAGVGGVSDFGGPGGGGGGIYSSGTASITECTIAQNKAGNGADSYNCGNTNYYGGNGGNGGGICNYGTLTIDSCTISGNTAGAPGCKATPGMGGGIYFGGTNGLTGSGGIYYVGTNGVCSMGNSIVANNVSADGIGNDVGGVVTSWGHNLVGVTNTCDGFGASGDLVGHSGAPLSAYIAPFSFYGGITKTMPPLPGSPAIDAGAVEPSLSVDQRGFPRVVGAGQDIGAVEGVVIPPPPCVISNLNFLSNNVFQFSFTNQNNISFTIFCTTNLAAPLNLWSNLGQAVENPAGSGNFEFTDRQMTNYPQRYYKVRWQ